MTFPLAKLLAASLLLALVPAAHAEPLGSCGEYADGEVTFRLDAFCHAQYRSCEVYYKSTCFVFCDYVRNLCHVV